MRLSLWRWGGMLLPMTEWGRIGQHIQDAKRSKLV
jgi:hypothetical protein